jgi:tRNA/rRNA methyltransferase
MVLPSGLLATNKMEIHFILVEPAVPENIGASARALKTMGFSSMRLVNPCDYLHVKSRMLAHGAQDVLENSKVYKSLESALHDIDFSIGTTAKRRSVKFDYHNSDNIPSLIREKKGAIKSLGIVFGREESGLTNEELQLCNIASSIPLEESYPSLNLSQAVMLYAYLMSPLRITSQVEYAPVEGQDWALLQKKAVEILNKVGIDSNPNLYHRMLERLSLINRDDMNLFMSFFNKLEEKLKK